MIHSLHGEVIAIGDESMIIEISGFGINVFPTASLLSQFTVGDEIFCYTHMQISEAGISMFAFANITERELFQELLQVKTVGGKLAITLLKHLSVEQIVKAIVSDNISVLTVPGVGTKRAERICFELKKKVSKKFPEILNDIPDSGSFEYDKFVVDALCGLGFSINEAFKAVTAAKKSNPSLDNEEDLLKIALSFLQK